MHRALVVIQVRFNSNRLCGKALLPLGGVPMLVYLIRRLKVLPASYAFVVATTEKVEDDPIVAWTDEVGIETVRGEENDLLARYIRCVKKFPSAIIVRVTADNPLTDPGIITKVVKLMKEERYDYVRAIRGYPIGIGVDAFTNSLLQQSYRNSTSVYEREHINAYVLNHLDEFKTNELPVPAGLNYPDVRLTVDTYQDYKFIKQLVDSYPRNHFIQIYNEIKRNRKRNIKRKVPS